MARQGIRRMLTAAPLFILALLVATAVPGLGQMEAPLNISVGSKAPDFALPSADGQTVRLSSLAGHTVLIDFYRGYY